MKPSKILILSESSICFSNIYSDYAEIKRQINPGDSFQNYILTAVDFDSNPDAISDNDKGGVPGSAEDNVLDDHGALDEDDHDGAESNPVNFDLRKYNPLQSINPIRLHQQVLRGVPSILEKKQSELLIDLCVNRGLLPDCCRYP